MCLDFYECTALFNFYKNLENELFETERFVTLEQSNFKTYSIEYAKLLISICSEIDMVLKMICRQINPEEQCSKINHYYRLLNKTFKYFTSEEVEVIYKRIKIRPWENWNESRVPKWWGDNNRLKHQRTDCDENGIPYYSRANLENVINALTALYISELYLFYINEPDIKPDGSKNKESRVLNSCKSNMLYMVSWHGCYTFFMSRDNSQFNLELLRSLMMSREDR